MAEDFMVALAASVFIPILLLSTFSEMDIQDQFRKRVDEKMHTHAADGSINGIRGWY